MGKGPTKGLTLRSGTRRLAGRKNGYSKPVQGKGLEDESRNKEGKSKEAQGLLVLAVVLVLVLHSILYRIQDRETSKIDSHFRLEVIAGHDMTHGFMISCA